MSSFVSPSRFRAAPGKAWARAWRDALVSGAIASALSSLVAVARSRAEAGDAASGTNATSHWVWGDAAAGRDGLDLRHTLVGYLIHHAASVFWAVLYEKALSRPPRSPPAVLRDAAAVAGLACFADYRIAPARLTPGFEKRLSRRSLFMIYAAFAAGLALRDLSRR